MLLKSTVPADFYFFFNFWRSFYAMFAIQMMAGMQCGTGKVKDSAASTPFWASPLVKLLLMTNIYVPNTARISSAFDPSPAFPLSSCG